MTAREIYDKVGSLMFWEESDKADYQPYWLDTLNRLLQENFMKNNVLRKMRGKEPFTATPQAIDLDTEVDYETEFTGNLLPLGGAGYLGFDDDRVYATEYKNKYEYEREQILAAGYEEIGNVYE